MERTFTASTKVALFLLAALFLLSVYRAALNDVTPGEAWNYDRYIAPTWQESLHQFDSNNHVLNTFLVRISTAALGRKEIALRLPSLLAGLLYCWAAWRLSRRLFVDGWGFTVSVGLLVLNPLVVDALSEARGYGMAMAAWLWALELFLYCLEQYEPHKLNLVAICLALSSTACVPFIIPALGLAVAAMWILRRGLVRDLWLPLLVFLFVLLALPLNRVLLTDFAQGANSLRQTLAELTAFSLSALPANATVLAGVVRILVGLLLAAGVVMAIRDGRRNPVLSLTTITACVGLVILIVAHARIKAPFPERGAVYFVPILTLVGLAMFRRHPRALIAVAAPCLLIYAAGFPAGAYLDGKEFAGSREIAKALRADVQQRPVSIAVSPELEPVVNYYRARYRQGNWDRVARKRPEPGYPYYVLATADWGLVEQFHLRVIRRLPGLLLAGQ